MEDDVAHDAHAASPLLGPVDKLGVDASGRLRQTSRPTSASGWDLHVRRHCNAIASRATPHAMSAEDEHAIPQTILSMDTSDTETGDRVPSSISGSVALVFAVCIRLEQAFLGVANN